MLNEMPIVGPAYMDLSLPTNAQELINMHLQAGGPGGKDSLQSVWGLKLVATTETDTARGMVYAKGLLWVVVGDSLYKVNPDSGVSTLIGAINGANDVVGMAFSFTELMIVRGDYAYIYNFSAATLSQITDTDFPAKADTVTYIDGYFLVSNVNGKFYCSDLNDGTSWNALYFTTAEGAPDEIQAIIADHREAFAMCDTSVEIYDNVGGTDFPFELRNGAFMEQGIAAKYSLAKGDNSLFWLANSSKGEVQVVRMAGYQPVVISNPFIEDEISKYDVISDAIGFFYKWGGRSTYSITFPTEGITWECDISTGNPQLAWRRRKTKGIGRWRANCHAAIGSKNYFGDYANGNIYVLDRDTYTENGDRLERVRTLPHMPPATYHSVELISESGVGLTSGQGSDPKVHMSWSDNMGRTYGNILARDVGKIGEYDKRQVWHKLGRSEKPRTFKLYYSEPTKFTILGLLVDADSV